MCQSSGIRWTNFDSDGEPTQSLVADGATTTWTVGPANNSGKRKEYKENLTATKYDSRCPPDVILNEWT